MPPPPTPYKLVLKLLGCYEEEINCLEECVKKKKKVKNSRTMPPTLLTRYVTCLTLMVVANANQTSLLC